MSKSFEWNSAEMWDTVSLNIFKIEIQKDSNKNLFMAVWSEDIAGQHVCRIVGVGATLINITNIPTEPCTIHRPQKIKVGDVVWGHRGNTIIVGVVTFISRGSDDHLLQLNNNCDAEYFEKKFTRGLPIHLFNEDGTRK